MPKVLTESKLTGNTAVPYITSHISGTGADHSYIDQNVTTTGTPTFGSLTLNGDLQMNSNHILSIGAPTLSSHVATKGYVDTQLVVVENAFTWKNPVRVATTAAGTLATDFENGDTVDGITLVTGDRILIKNQADATENGIYTVAVSGPPSRTDDYAAGISASGTGVIVTEGTTFGDTFFICSSNSGSDVVGTDTITYGQITGGATYTAGDGIDVTGTVISAVVTDFAGTGLEDDGSNNLRIAAAAAGDGLQGGGGSALAVDVSDFAGAGLEDDGSENLRIAAAAAGAGLTGGGGSALAVGAGDGITVNANDVAVNVGDFAGTGLEDDLSNNLRIAAAAAGSGLTGGGGSALAVGAGDGITVNANDVAVNVGDFAGTGLEDDLSNNLRIAAAAAGAGLTGGGGSALAVGAGDGITVNANDVAVNVGDFAGTGLEDDLSNNLRIAAAAAGAGLTGGGGSALAVGAGDGITVNASDVQVNVSDIAGTGLENDGSNNLRIAASAAGAGLTGGAGSSLGVGAGDGITVNANDVAVNVSDIAGTNLENDGSNNLRIVSDPSFTGGLTLGGALNMGSNLINNVTTPSASTDAATKGYVDGQIDGVTWKEPVRVASTANGTLATDFENGDTLDGVTLATNDRILLKNQSTGTENGIYVVNASGAPTRADDLANGASAAGIALIVNEGSTNADSLYFCSTNSGSDVVGTNSLAFSQLGGGSTYTGGDGIDVTGTVISAVVADFAGTNLEDDGSNNLRIAATAAGAGLTGGGASALAVGAGDGITVNANDVQVTVSDFAGTGLEDDLSNNLRIAAAAAGNGLTGGGGSALAVGAGDGITVNANDVQVNVSDFAGTNLEDDGSNNLRIAATAAGAGLTGGGASALAVGAGDGITVNANDVQVTVSAIAGTGLEDDGSNNLRISAAAAGDGLQGGGGSALAVDVSAFAGTGLEDDGSENLRIATSAAGNGLTGGGGSALAVNLTTDTYYATSVSEITTALTDIGTSGNPSRILIAPGTYTLSSAITVSVSNVVIQGSGKGVTTFETDGSIINLFVFSGTTSYVTLRDMTLDAFNATAGGAAIYHSPSATLSDFLIENIEFTRLSITVGMIENGGGVTLTDFTFRNCSFDGTAAIVTRLISEEDSTNTRYIDCVFVGDTGGTNAIIQIDDTTDIGFYNCRFIGIRYIEFSGATSNVRPSFVNCLFESCTDTTSIIKVPSAALANELSVTGCRFNDCAGYALGVSSSGLVHFDGNILSGTLGLTVANSTAASTIHDRVVFTNNTVTNITGDGVSIGTSVTIPVIVKGNNFSEDSNDNIGTSTFNIEIKDNHLTETTTGTTVTLEKMTSHALVTSGATDTTLTVPDLPVGSAGHCLYIELDTDGGGDCVITPTSFINGDTLLLTNAGDYAILEWTGLTWIIKEYSPNGFPQFSSITTTAGTNVSTVTVLNGALTEIGGIATFDIVFQLAVTSADTDSDFTLTVPKKASNFNNTYEGMVTCNGWFNNTTPDAIGNVVGHSVASSKNIKFRFTTSDTNAHYISASIRYSLG